MGRFLSRVLKVSLALLFGAACVTFVYRGLTWDLGAKAREDPVDVESAPVVRGDIHETVVATGTLEPAAWVVVQSEIPGIVQSVAVDDGQRVDRDQPLVVLDSERLRRHTTQLRAAWERNAALARTDLVGRARATLEDVERRYERVRGLVERGVASRERLDETEHALRLARIALNDAESESAARRAAVKEAEGALRVAEQDLEKSTIRSPIDGVVVRREVEVGTAVADLQNGGTVIALLADDRSMHLRANVDEHDVARVRVGQTARIYIDAFPGETFVGDVRRISSSGRNENSMSRFELEIGVETDRRPIRVGMSADARIEVMRHRDALLVPTAAVVHSASGSSVRVAANTEDGFRLVPIDEAYSDGSKTAVRGELAVGDLVLIDRRGPG